MQNFLVQSLAAIFISIFQTMSESHVSIKRTFIYSHNKMGECNIDNGKKNVFPSLYYNYCTQSEY